MSPVHLAAVILTKNEAKHVTACIQSLIDWTDQVIVFDSHSDDETCAIAARAGAEILQHPFENFGAQRQAALDQIVAEWILFIDADERATPAFADEVSALIRGETSSLDPVGYWLPRRNFILGKEVRHGGYFPDYQLRLLRRDAARMNREREVHETVELEGEAGHMTAPILHFNYQSWDQFHKKQRFYAAYEARILAARGVRPRPHNFILQPLREFVRRYITLQGWRDGWQGFQLAFLFAWYYGFVPYWVLVDKEKTRDFAI